MQIFFFIKGIGLNLGLVCRKQSVEDRVKNGEEFPQCILSPMKWESAQPTPRMSSSNKSPLVQPLTLYTGLGLEF